ncbi:MAG: hypothetical protein NVV67_16615 [Pseudoxanthomonas sp.]|nr:hypothetical protein [Pseudoxanthomonas sp.]
MQFVGDHRVSLEGLKALCVAVTHTCVEGTDDAEDDGQERGEKEGSRSCDGLEMVRRATQSNVQLRNGRRAVDNFTGDIKQMAERFESIDKDLMLIGWKRRETCARLNACKRLRKNRMSGAGKLIHGDPLP